MTAVRFLGGPAGGRLVEIADPLAYAIPAVDDEGRCAGTYYVAPVPRETFALWQADGERVQKIGARLADILDPPSPTEAMARAASEAVGDAVRDVLAKGAHPATIRLEVDGNTIRVIGYAAR